VEDQQGGVRTATVAGRTLEYVDVGAGPVVVLVHGTGGSWTFWRETIPALSRNVRVIVPSLPGHGGSERLADPPADLFPYADSLAGLLDALDVGDAVVVGHSLGGLVALRFALTHRSRTAALVLVDSGGAAVGRIRLAAVTRFLRLASSLAARPGFVRAVTTRIRLRRRMLAYAVHDSAAMTVEMLRDALKDFSVPGVVDAIRAGALEQAASSVRWLTVPTTVIWGRYDRILPLRLGVRLAQAIPGAALEVIDGAGHAPMLDRPDDFARAIRRAVARAG
jgi:pimeloyl-ACP methyl ester carboxylesterase